MSLQGSETKLPVDFYKIAINYINDGQSVLNFGCGKTFVFEKQLYNFKKSSITSVDILDIKGAPEFIKEFVRKSVEEEIFFDKKFDVVTFFELIEHIDKTDVLLKNCFNNLKDDGYLIFSFPNLASIYARIELLLGFQPHVLEVSNKVANLGAGIFGKFNGGRGPTIHHIRGITRRAMRDLLDIHGFKVVREVGYEWRFKKFFYYFPSIAPVNIFVCRKK